jgi:hypothetical protein
LEAFAVSLGLSVEGLIILISGSGLIEIPGAPGVYVGEIDKTISRVVSGTVSATTAVASLDSTYLIFVQDTQRKVLDPARKVTRIHDGAYDSFNLEEITANDTEWAVLFS